MYKTELHIHTRYSKDSILAYWVLILFLKIKKINTVAITDHNEIAGAIKYKKKFEKHGINLIIGEEIFTNKGEIIGLGLKEKIEPDQSPESTIAQIKQQGGIVYVPHPYDEKRYKTVLEESAIAKNRNKIDLIEVHNGRNISKDFSKKQEEIAKKYGIRPIVGSDAHTFFELGRNYISTEKIITADNLVKEAKNATFSKKQCISFAHKWTRFARIVNIIKKGDKNELHRVVNKRRS